MRTRIKMTYERNNLNRVITHVDAALNSLAYAAGSASMLENYEMAEECGHRIGRSVLELDLLRRQITAELETSNPT